MGRGTHYCGVHNCSNNSRSNPTLIFFSVTKDMERSRIWLKLMGREDVIENPRKIMLCSIHFAPDDIKNRRLKNRAIPSLHLPQRKTVNSFNPPNNYLLPSIRQQNEIIALQTPSQQYINEIITKLISIEDNVQPEIAIKKEMESPSPIQKSYTVGTQTDEDLEYSGTNEKPPLFVANIATQTDFGNSYLLEALQRKSSLPTSEPKWSFCRYCGHTVRATQDPVLDNINIETINEPKEKTSQLMKLPKTYSKLKLLKDTKKQLNVSGKRKSEENVDKARNEEPCGNKICKSNRPIIIFESDLSSNEDDEEMVFHTSVTFDTSIRGPESNTKATITPEEVPSTSNATFTSRPNEIVDKTLENSLDNDVVHQFNKWQDEFLSTLDKLN